MNGAIYYRYFLYLGDIFLKIILKIIFKNNFVNI